jgi:hypothetical protein
MTPIAIALAQATFSTMEWALAIAIRRRAMKTDRPSSDTCWSAGPRAMIMMVDASSG